MKQELSTTGRALITVVLFRLIFGGYLTAMDQYRYVDVDSAYTVIIIYALIAAFTALYLHGRPIGLKALIALDAVFLILNTVFVAIALGGYADVGMHSPLNNLIETLLRYTFSILTLTLAVKTLREPADTN